LDKDIRKNKDKVLKFTDSIETSEGLKRKSLKLADDDQLDKELYAWFIQQRSTGTPIWSASSRENEIFLYAVKHSDAQSQIQSISWLPRKV